MKVQLVHKFEDIICVENLLEAWKEFITGKKNKADVQEFSLRLMDNIFDLRFDLANLTYKHRQYQVFSINDPKPRLIHKAIVRDRLLHHAIFANQNKKANVVSLKTTPISGNPRFLYGVVGVGEWAQVER